MADLTVSFDNEAGESLLADNAGIWRLERASRSLSAIQLFQTGGQIRDC